MKSRKPRIIEGKAYRLIGTCFCIKEFPKDQEFIDHALDGMEMMFSEDLRNCDKRFRDMFYGSIYDSIIIRYKCLKCGGTFIIEIGDREEMKKEDEEEEDD